MKLLSLTLSMFKGIKDFKLDCNGGNCNVYGDNAVGKTTLKDALTWLLFDKNSEDVKDFGIMRLDNGEVVHKTEPTVEAVFRMENDSTLTLKKVYKEVWTKPRGQLEEVLSRHTTDYYIDGVPKSATEYKKFIASIIDEKRFKVLTEPRYFNENLKPEERRAMLLDIVGGVDQSVVIAQSPDLRELGGLLRGKTVEDFQRMTKASIKDTQKRIDEIAPAIRECENMKPAQDAANQGLYEAQAQRLRDRVALLQGDIAQVKAGRTDPATVQAYNDRCKELAELRRAWHEKQEKARTAFLSEVKEAEHQQADTEAKLRRAQSTLDNLEMQKQSYATQRERLVQEFQTERSRTLHVAEDVQTICPVCKQGLPAEIVEKARENVKAEVQQFNLDRAERLKAINVKGKAVAAEISKIEEQQAELVPERDVLKRECQDAEDRAREAREALREFDTQELPAPEEIVAAEKEVARLKKQIDTPDADVESQIAELEKQKQELQTQIDEAVDFVAACKQAQQIEMRIRELKDQEQELGKTYMQLQKHQHLCGQYTRRLTEYIDSKVADHFQVARFRLFKNNITNDGIEECCDTMMDGKPYDSLNAAAQVEVGLDIILTLAKQYDFSAPVMIDNAESYTQLPDTGDLQIIRLIVSAADKTLRVEQA